MIFGREGARIVLEVVEHVYRAVEWILDQADARFVTVGQDAQPAIRRKAGAQTSVERDTGTSKALRESSRFGTAWK